MKMVEDIEERIQRLKEEEILAEIASGNLIIYNELCLNFFRK